MRLFQSFQSTFGLISGHWAIALVCVAAASVGCSSVNPDASIRPDSSAAQLVAVSPTPADAAGGAIAPSPIANQPASVAQSPADTLAIEQLAIAGVQLSTPESTVRQQLGAPLSQVDEDWACCGMVRTLNYGQTTVKLLESLDGETFEVFSFHTSNADLATKDGIRVGDSRQKLLATYGTPDGSYEEEEDGMTTLVYGAPVDYAAALWFKLTGDRIVEIGYDAQLN